MSSVQVFSSLSKEERRKVMEDGTRMYGGRTEDRTAFKSIEEQQKVPLLLFFSKFFFFFFMATVFSFFILKERRKVVEHGEGRIVRPGKGRE